MKQQIILSGIGGQGVISAGEMMCEAIAKKGVNVTFVPVYGGEQRGGKTMCQIVISDKTDTIPAWEDEAAVQGVREIAEWLNRGDTP